MNSTPSSNTINADDVPSQQRGKQTATQRLGESPMTTWPRVDKKYCLAVVRPAPLATLIEATPQMPQGLTREPPRRQVPLRTHIDSVLLTVPGRARPNLILDRKQTSWPGTDKRKHIPCLAHAPKACTRMGAVRCAPGSKRTEIQG